MFNSVNTLYYKRNTQREREREREKSKKKKEGKKKMIRYCPSGTV